jgi:hypothetical protein
MVGGLAFKEEVSCLIMVRKGDGVRQVPIAHSRALPQ